MESEDCKTIPQAPLKWRAPKQSHPKAVTDQSAPRNLVKMIASGQQSTGLKDLPADLTRMVESLQDFCSTPYPREVPTVKLVLSPPENLVELPHP